MIGTSDLMIFEGNEVEVFEFDGEVLFNPKHVAKCLELSESGLRNHLAKMNNNQAKILKNLDVLNKDFRKLNNAGEKFLTESGVYKLIFKSNKENAEEFQDWIADEVLPSIRKTGSYGVKQISEKEQCILCIYSGGQEAILSAKRLSEIEVEEATKPLITEINHKEDVIVGLVEDIDLCTKRQRINQIIRYKAKNNFNQRWKLLYSEFSKKYHMDLDRRMKSCNIKPKVKNKLDYIDRALQMIPQLYELTCKVFENDVEELKKEWINTASRENNLYTKEQGEM